MTQKITKFVKKKKNMKESLSKHMIFFISILILSFILWEKELYINNVKSVIQFSNQNLLFIINLLILK